MRIPIVAVTVSLLLGGCASSLKSSDNKLLGLITPYKIEVVQGNVLTREQIEQVRSGMTRAQVRDVLGSPLLADIFHADRWDYVFTIRRQGTPPQQRNVVVLFENDQLKSIEAAELPSEREFVASITNFKRPRTPKLELSEAEREALPTPRRRDTEPPLAAPAGGTVREYPPLEPRI